ncbi:hypothetical protein PG994_015149 [Apiospora phragmitis]|uniref:Uncharacterized protein n=1 Tax=Apiospora phragmitis TaxID=2905665 RepID=A0ABR1SVN5_9PEZI
MLKDQKVHSYSEWVGEQPYTLRSPKRHGAVPSQQKKKRDRQAQNARPRLERALHKLQLDNSNEENQKRIAYLEAQLLKKDQELQEAFDSEEFEVMEIDVDSDSEDIKSEPTSPRPSSIDDGLDPDGEKPLFSRPGPASGQEVTTVGWVRNGRYYINMYGKKSAAKYRLDKYADSAEYEDEPPAEQNISNSEIRFGSVKNPNGRLKYTKRHIDGLYGVAWNAINRSGADAVDLIDPDELQMLDGSLGKKRWPDTYVLIAWNIDGKIQKKWEPRSALRARWGTKEADIAIHKAAVEQECRYEEATTGRRPQLSRSPSVGLADNMVKNFRHQSIPVRSHNPAFYHTRFSEAAPPNKVSARGGPAMTKEEFIAFYCELAGAANFFDLDVNTQQKCVIAWAGVQEPRLVTV